MRSVLVFLCCILTFNTMAQDVQLPYHQIPDYPANYSSGNVLSRMVDGLGFRYYWATEGLTQSDLDFKPSADARSAFETLQHLYGLSEMIMNASQNTPSVRPLDWSGMTFEQLRQKTLEQLDKASKLFASMSEEELSEAKVIFQNGENKTEFPLWNIMNGPIADALNHTGQIVSFRRSSGNPINPKVNVFMGRTGS